MWYLLSARKLFHFNNSREPCAKPHSATNPHLPTDKNFPQEHPRPIKRTKFSLCKGGCCWGKFWGGQGGLEGRRPSAKEGLLRLQGLSLTPPRSSSHPSSIFPSMETVTTCHGMNFPLARRADFAACSKPPQQGTSIRTTVSERMSFSERIAVSFSV